jgi:hypothetical protein
MNEIGKADRVLNEEYRDVVADDVPVALLRIELDREAADIAGKIGRALAAGYRRETAKGRRSLASALEYVGPRVLGE